MVGPTCQPVGPTCQSLLSLSLFLSPSLWSPSSPATPEQPCHPRLPTPVASPLAALAGAAAHPCCHHRSCWPLLTSTSAATTAAAAAMSSTAARPVARYARRPTSRRARPGFALLHHTRSPLTARRAPARPNATTPALLCSRPSSTATQNQPPSGRPHVDSLGVKLPRGPVNLFVASPPAGQAPELQFADERRPPVRQSHPHQGHHRGA